MFLTSKLHKHRLVVFKFDEVIFCLFLMFSHKNKLHTFGLLHKSIRFFSNERIIWRCENFFPKRFLTPDVKLFEEKRRAAIIINSQLPENFQNFWTFGTELQNCNLCSNKKNMC